MKQKVEPVERVLNYLDAFGQPITLKSNGMVSYKSTCGSITTIIIVTILLIYSWMKLDSL